jgi:hypothetical protein
MVILAKHGQTFSLSPGERAGVRASLLFNCIVPAIGEGRGEGELTIRTAPFRLKSLALKILGRKQTEALHQILSRIGQQRLPWKFMPLRPTTRSIGARRFIGASVTFYP